MLQAKQNGCDRALLTQQLRRYSTDHVKIAIEDTEQAKHLVDNYIKKESCHTSAGNHPYQLASKNTQEACMRSLRLKQLMS